MHGVEAIQTALKGTQGLVKMVLGDLSDADLLVRPTPGANHIAWQLGHFITVEHSTLKSLVPSAVLPELPAGFAQQHGKETASQDPPTGFLGRAEYVDLFDKVRQASIQAVGTLGDDDLDRKVEGSLSRIAPTVGAAFLLHSNHSLMHAGQFSVVRRKLGKPVLF